MDLSQAASDIRAILHAAPAYYIENKASNDYSVLEMTCERDSLPGEDISALLTSKHAPHISGCIIDVTRSCVRVKLSKHTTTCKKRGNTDRVKIGKLALSHANASDCAEITQLAQDMADCSSTGLRPSLEIEVKDHTYLLYSCKVAQYCGFSVHTKLSGKRYWFDMRNQELVAELSRTERANKRVKR